MDSALKLQLRHCSRDCGLDPSIRWLHFFEALPYFAIVILARRNTRWGYALGIATALFWIYSAAFVTNFFGSGVRALTA